MKVILRTLDNLEMEVEMPGKDLLEVRRLIPPRPLREGMTLSEMFDPIPVRRYRRAGFSIDGKPVFMEMMDYP